MQYKIPQNVQRTDRILGPFTLRQFLYLIAGSSLGYIVFSMASKLSGSNELGFLFGVIVFACMGSFAVIEIQGKPLPEFITAMIMFSLRPKHRIWQKDIYVPDIAFMPPKKEEEEEETEPKNISQMKNELEKLAHILDTRGWGELTEDTEEEPETEPLPGEEPEEKPKMDTGQEKKISTIEKLTPEEKAVREELEKEKKEAKKVSTSLKKELISKERLEAKTEKPPIKKEVEPKKEPVKEEISAQPKEEKALPVPKEEKALPAPSRTSRVVQVKKQVAKTINQMEKEIAEKAIKQKEMIKKFKSTVSEIEHIFKKPPKLKVPSKQKIKIIPTVSFLMPESTKEKEQPYVEEYKIDLGNRITTPRFEESATNIRVDETKLEDVLENTKGMKTLKRELEEVETALKKQRTKKKPRIIKGGGSIVDIKKEENSFKKVDGRKSLRENIKKAQKINLERKKK